MATELKITIIICTYNRAHQLQQTLASIGQAKVPTEWECELVVVDNASTDDTASIVQKCQLPNMPVHYVLETQRGLSNARNAGLMAAQGEIILFTDDDVRVPEEWIAGMCELIVTDQADAVAGGIRIAPHLERPWMLLEHRGSYAEVNESRSVTSAILVGANMAFSRTVLHSIPAFDTEIGAGTTYECGEEGLFSDQIGLAGYRVATVYHIAVEHHFQGDRLLRRKILESQRGRGRSAAYLAYHWRHQEYKWTYLRIVLNQSRFLINRLIHAHKPVSEEGMPSWEMRGFWTIEMLKQYRIEQKQPRKYEKYGLRKLSFRDSEDN